MFSKKATKVDEIFTVDLTLTACQIGGEDFLNFCGLLRNHELYKAAQELVIVGIDVLKKALEEDKIVCWICNTNLEKVLSQCS